MCLDLRFLGFRILGWRIQGLGFWVWVHVGWLQSVLVPGFRVHSAFGCFRVFGFQGSGFRAQVFRALEFEVSFSGNSSDAILTYIFYSKHCTDIFIPECHVTVYTSYICLWYVVVG